MIKERDNRTQIIAQCPIKDLVVQLAEDDASCCFLRWISSNGNEHSRSQPLHVDQAALTLARELFPDYFPFLALPVDAS